MEYLAYVMRAYPDLTWERTLPPMYAEHEPRTAFWWRGTGTFTGVLDPPGIAGTGRAFTFEGVEVFDFRGDRATRLRAAYDRPDEADRRLEVLVKRRLKASTGDRRARAISLSA